MQTQTATHYSTSFAFNLHVLSDSVVEYIIYNNHLLLYMLCLNYSFDFHIKKITVYTVFLHALLFCFLFWVWAEN